MRTILHMDMNNFYASVECVFDPSLKDKPVVVCGDPDSRHGIVLAKNEKAKKYDIKTGEPIWQSRRKCPDVVFVPPHFDRYSQFSKDAREICYSYTNLVEGFGPDENWLDVTNSANLFGSGEEIAHKLRRRIKAELGVTVSVGVSFNKTFAKLGSDYKKPDAVTVISYDNYRQIVWPLPAADLLFVGRHIGKKLEKAGIRTIGELARCNAELLQAMFGKVGLMLHNTANGIDDSPVADMYDTRAAKSVSNGVTLPYDLTKRDEVKAVLINLSENIGTRLRKMNVACKTVALTIRYKDLSYKSKRVTLVKPTNNALDIWKTAFDLYLKNAASAVRALTVHCENFTEPERCLSFLEDDALDEKQNKFETALDDIKRKYGKKSIISGEVLANPKLDFDLSKKINSFAKN